MATRWDNAIIARLAAGDRCTDDFCGAVLVCSWPMPPEVALAYAKLSASLRAALPPEAYIYPASTLHCTVATLRAFTGGPLDADARRRLVAAWTPVLEAARRAPEWPKGEFQLRMGPPTLEGAAGKAAAAQVTRKACVGCSALLSRVCQASFGTRTAMAPSGRCGGASRQPSWLPAACPRSAVATGRAPSRCRALRSRRRRTSQTSCTQRP